MSLVSLLCALCACDDPSEGNKAAFAFDAVLTQPESFYDFPYPSDLRLDANGAPDLTGLPIPHPHEVMESLRALVAQRKGFPAVPVAYFRFEAPIAPRDPENVIAASKSEPLLLIDVDETSPERGRLFPVVAATPAVDDYVPENLLAMAARPGFVLEGRRKYAFVVLRSLNDAAGQPLGVPPALTELADDETPEGANAAAVAELYAPLWATLDKIELDREEVAAATVFTTSDVVVETAALSTALLEKHSVQVTGLALDSDDGASHERYCELHGTVRYPQFQKGVPPFNTQGLFQFGADGLPTKQRDEDAPVVINLPRGLMPAEGYPLLVFFHGSGGLSTGVVDRGGVSVTNGPDKKGFGPAHVIAAHGVASAASALPVNPQRLDGAGETAYLNLSNLAAFRDTFRQGLIEQRLFIAALRTLEISPDALSDCTGPTLLVGATKFKFAPEKLVAQGQSMGGMYTNMIGAVEPRIRAVVPTGAGGFWSYFILKTSLIPDVANLIALLLRTPHKLTFLHPGMNVLESAWEPADPMVYMPRLARRPLPGHPVRPIYEPVGKGDSYFPTVLYDAIALAYGHQQAGTEVWPTMQPALSLDGLAGILPYPVRQNRASAAGAAYTGVIVQYEGDGIDDPHAIYKQLDAVKYQYGCFVSTFLETGVGVVPAPAALGTPCPR